MARKATGLRTLLDHARRGSKDSPSALYHIDKQLMNPPGGIDLANIADQLEELAIKARQTLRREIPRHDFLMSFAEVFFETALSYDGSGKTHLHPSSFMSDCQRKLYYDLTDTPYSDEANKNIDPQLQRIFDVGTIHHLYLQYLLYRSGVLAEAEMNVINKAARVGGKTDGRLEFPQWKKPIGLEIKTANEFSFSKAKLKPLKKHIDQVTVYGHYSGIDEWLFVYINKNTQAIAEHFYTINENDRARVQHTVRAINKSVALKRVPKRMCKSKFDESAYNCPYRSHCFKL